MELARSTGVLAVVSITTRSLIWSCMSLRSMVVACGSTFCTGSIEKAVMTSTFILRTGNVGPPAARGNFACCAARTTTFYHKNTNFADLILIQLQRAYWCQFKKELLVGKLRCRTMTPPNYCIFLQRWLTGFAGASAWSHRRVQRGQRVVRLVLQELCIRVVQERLSRRDAGAFKTDSYLYLQHPEGADNGKRRIHGVILFDYRRVML